MASKTRKTGGFTLINEQLSKGHIIESFSPWDSPVFIIQKKSVKWKMLMIWELLMLFLFQWVLYDLVYLILVWFQEIGICYWPQSCCFTIPLHPDDQPRFAFSVPCINLKEPHKRFQWTALPQGMLNSPTICQNFVAEALNPAWQQFPHACIIHFMDDIHDYKKERWHFWHWMAMIFFRLWRKLVKIKSFLKLQNRFFLHVLLGKSWLVKILFWNFNSAWETKTGLGKTWS